MERFFLSEILNKIVVAQDMQNTDPISFAWQFFTANKNKGAIPSMLQISNEIDETIVAVAEVWHGGWIVPCPWSGRAHAGLGLEYGDPDYPLFMCCSCWNQVAGGKFIRVAYPVQAKQIEIALLQRPDGRTRGWVPSQTTEDLLAENAEHGVI